MPWSVRLSRRIRDGLLAILGVAALSFAAFFALHEPLRRPVRLRMTAGQDGGTRHRIAQALRREAAQRAIAIELQAMAGSEAAIQAMESGLVDAAFVQGGLDMIDHPGIRQVAVLHLEPLHLLVKEDIYRTVTRNLGGLRGKLVNIGKRGSGTYLLATEVMAFSGLRTGIDYTESNYSYADLERQPAGSQLPDAVFTVSTLPSPIARLLVTRHHYRLASLPFCEAFALGALDEDHAPPYPPGHTASRIDRRRVYDAMIPAFAYEIEPGVPPEPIHTLGTRLLLEGKSRRDAAGQLGIPEGTLSTRLARGRKLLRERLLRRGFTLGVPIAGLSPSSIEPAIPERLMEPTLRAAMSDAPGCGTAGTISQTVSSLAERVIKMMFLVRLTLLVAAFLTVSTAITAVVLAWPARAVAPAIEDPPRAGKDDLAGRVIDKAGTAVADVQVWAVGGAWSSR